MTGAAARVGLFVLEGLGGSHCNRSFAHQRIRLAAVGQVTSEFVLAYDRCPTGTPELVEARLLERNYLEDPWGGAILTFCLTDSKRTTIFVVAPGPDGRYSTADDITYSSD